MKGKATKKPFLHRSGVKRQAMPSAPRRTKRW
jgi:hypothetical protein